MSINEIESKVKELRELRRMQEDLAAEIASIEDSLNENSLVKYPSTAQF